MLFRFSLSSWEKIGLTATNISIHLPHPKPTFSTKKVRPELAGHVSWRCWWIDRSSAHGPPCHRPRNWFRPRPGRCIKWPREHQPICAGSARPTHRSCPNSFPTAAWGFRLNTAQWLPFFFIWVFLTSDLSNKGNPWTNQNLPTWHSPSA